MRKIAQIFVAFSEKLNFITYYNVKYIFIYFSLEMLILDNVDSTNSMPLSIQSVKWIIEHAPKLIMLGNLRSWCGIDYFDSNSPYFYKSESELSRLKKEIINKNWDVDLDIENLDHLYT